jgi:hypothetical protein
VVLAPLATSIDLSDLGVDITNTALVTKLLAAVSDAVRDAAGSLITRTTSTVIIPTVPSRRLILPARPVRSVTSVTLDGDDVTDYVLRGSALWRECPWQARGAIPGEVVVEFEHGYDTVPEDVVKLVCSFVAAGLAEATSDGSTRGVSSETIDDYQVSYTRGADEVVDLTELPDRTKAALRARFGGAGTNVVRTVH